MSPTFKNTLWSLLAATLALAAGACEGPVDPARVKLRFGGEVRAPDAVVVRPAWEGDLHARPGERLTLHFWLIDGVRDELFLQVDDTTAYVAGLTLYGSQPAAPTGAIGIEAPIPAPPAIDPAATSATYRRLLPNPRTPGVITSPAAEAYIPIDLTVALPKSDFTRAELSIVFCLRGYTRHPSGEIRDTLIKKVTILPVDKAAGATSRPITQVKPG